MKTQNSIKNYEIRVIGHLGKNAAIWFEDFQIEYSATGETILRGPVIDQAALFGISHIHPRSGFNPDAGSTGGVNIENKRLI